MHSEFILQHMQFLGRLLTLIKFFFFFSRTPGKKQMLQQISGYRVAFVLKFSAWRREGKIASEKA